MPERPSPRHPPPDGTPRLRRPVEIAAWTVALSLSAIAIVLALAVIVGLLQWML